MPTKTLTLSASARAKVAAFLAENAGVHMPTISQIETAIEKRFSAMTRYVRRDDLIGTHICYRSGSPASAAYRYQVRSLSATFVIRARSIDLVDMRVEKLYPKTRERVDVYMRHEAMETVRRGVASVFEAATKACYHQLDLRHDESEIRIPRHHSLIEMAAWYVDAHGVPAEDEPEIGLPQLLALYHAAHSPALV